MSFRWKAILYKVPKWKCTTITSSKCYAGHSKWANIKHIKAEKDGQRSKMFDKLIQRIKIAIQEGGSANPITNIQLSQAIDNARRSNMPVATIENVIKTAQVNKSRAVSVQFEAKGPKGCIIIISASTDNQKRTKDTLTSILKRNNGMWAEGVGHLFDGKGVIETKSGDNSNNLEDHAIIAGAEDVEDFKNGTVKFICSVEEMRIVEKRLEELGYKIVEADVDFIPKNYIQLNEADLTLANKLMDKLVQHPDVLRIFTNIVHE